MNSGNNWAQNNSQNYANQLAAQQGLHQGRVMTHAERELLERIVDGKDHEGICAARRAVRLERISPAKIEAFEAAYWELLKARGAYAKVYSEAFGRGELSYELAKPYEDKLNKRAKEQGLIE